MTKAHTKITQTEIKNKLKLNRFVLLIKLQKAKLEMFLWQVTEINEQITLKY